jgi:cytochrome bd-type quinol oxidase subunit 2
VAEATGDRPAGERPAAAGGPGRVLVAVYGVFALAAGARAAVQLATRFDEAPVAYLLSALAAGVYVVATVALARGGRRTALVAITVELIGVLVVGTLSLLDPAAFPDETVWSAYGRGYNIVPLVLPVLGLLLLRRQRADQKSPPPKSPPPKSP